MAKETKTDKTGNDHSILSTVYDFFASLQFAIFILTLIASSSILGTLVKQGAPEEEYLSFYSESTYRIIKFFSLDDAYHSTWFYLIIFLFAVNLILCTLRRFRRLLEGRRIKSTPSLERFAKFEFSFTVKANPDPADTLSKSYRLVVKDDKGAVFEKGGIGRYGVFVVHASILIVLVGTLVGQLFGFKASLMLSKGETKDRVAMRGDTGREVPLGFAVTCNDFQVSFYPNGTPRDYVSTIAVTEGGKTVRETKVRVNAPLSYRGLRFYQSSYGKTTSFRFRVGTEEVLMAEKEPYRQGDLMLLPMRSAPQVHGLGPGVEVAYLEGGEPRSVWFLAQSEKFRTRRIGDVDITLEEIREQPYTVLEVAKDPGVWIVWTGFALLLCGLYLTFFVYYRRIYAFKAEEGTTVISGWTAKNRDGFRREFDQLKEVFHDSTP